MSKQKQAKQSDLPSKIKCVKCSKECGVRPDVLEARIKLHGSLAKLQAEYFCRGCRKKHTYIVNDKPLAKKTSNGHVISPLLKRVLNREMWWQQPGFVFPGSGDKYPAVGPTMTWGKDAKGQYIAVPMKGVQHGSTLNVPVVPVTEEE